MKYYVTHNKQKGFNDIINRIKDVGKNAYIYYNCIPTSIITLQQPYQDFDKGKQFIVFENYNDKIDYFRFLGFGYEGLYEDEEKIKVLENFGKYRCIVYEENEIQFSNDIIVEDFDF